MNTPQVLGRMLLVSMLALPLAACATGSPSSAPSSTPARAKMSTKKLCEASGGTYAGTTCTPGKSTSAEAICQAHGGIYMSGEDYCDIPYN